MPGLAEQSLRGPRRGDKRHHERKQHRGRGADRNRAHVGAHEAADERHRQNGGDDREGRQDGWIADLVDGPDGQCGERRGLARRQPGVAHHVLHDDDGIVDEDADGEDEREERDPVERVPVDPEDEQRERERDRDGHEHHGRLAAAQREPDEHRDRHDRDQHVPEQLVRLVGRGLAVVARDRHLEVGRQQDAAYHPELLFDASGQALTPLRLAMATVTAG